MTELREKLNNIVEEKQTKILPENLKAGVEAFGVTGNFTSDATATAEDIAKDKTAYVNGEKITGAMEIINNEELETSFISLLDDTMGSNTTKLPNNITSIRNYAFYYCTNLALEELPNNVKKIGKYAFGNCKNLPLKKLPSNLKSIDEYAFVNCTNLALEEIPDSVTTIKAQAFINCTNLPLKKLPSHITVIEASTFSNCTNLAITKIPDSVGTIATYAFEGCTSLTSIELSSGLKQLLGYIFRNCTNLTEVICNGNVTNISGLSFSGCTKLSKFSLANVTSVTNLNNKNAFLNTQIANGTGYIYVPDDLVEDFKAATNWSTYAGQIKGVSELV